MSEHIAICKACGAACGIRVTVEDGRVTRILGDRENAVSGGYTCAKGRALPEQHNDPNRLLHTMARQSDGSFKCIDADAAMDDIARRLGRIVAEHGPRSVALYTGNGLNSVLGGRMAKKLMDAIGSSMTYSSLTIDQPAKVVAGSMHGHWGGGAQGFATADVWVLVGTNPVVSTWAGIMFLNPSATLRDAKKRGCRIILIDPREAETARFADIHLRPRPGTDAPLLAGMVRQILAEGLWDRDFCAEHAKGIDTLRRAVEPFTPEITERHTGVPAADVIAAARMYGSGTRGCATAGVGPNMAAGGTLVEYLLLSLVTLKGFWRREGEGVDNPGVLSPPRSYAAQAIPQPAWWEGEKTRIRNLAKGPQGMPTAALADEILLDGPGQVRAMFCLGGNPAVSFPDQIKTVKALRKLELLVVFDIRMSQTARFADYAFGVNATLESPAVASLEGFDQILGPTCAGFPIPFAQFAPALVSPPPGSETVLDWRVLLGIASRMGLQLEINGLRLTDPPQPEEEIIEACYRGSRVPFDEVRRSGHGAIFPSDIRVGPADPDRPAEARLELGHPLMMAELGTLAAKKDPTPHFPEGEGLPLVMLTRRMATTYNSSHQQLSGLRRIEQSNFAFMHPDDMARLGIQTGGEVQLRSERASIRAVAKADKGAQAGTISISHGWGDVPERDGAEDVVGANTNRLVSTDAAYDPYSGIPIMSSLPVRVTAADVVALDRASLTAAAVGGPRLGG